MKVYLAARFERKEELQHIAIALEYLGIEVTSKWIWTKATRAQEEGEPTLASEIAVQDLEHVAAADVVVAFADADRRVRRGGGRHFELGYAHALGKKLILVGGPEILFHWLPDIERVATVSKMYSILEGLLLEEEVMA